MDSAFSAAVREQLKLFGPERSLPAGLRYHADLISREEERALLAPIQDLPFKEFEFHGYLGKRRVVSFGWRYDFEKKVIREAMDLPAFLLPLRERAAAFAEVDADQLVQALVSEYSAGAGIGWHVDKGVFGDVIGVSLLAPCVFRMRRRTGTKWQRASFTAEARSAYLLRGPARIDWEHSIPPVDTLRYSITFRTVLASAPTTKAS